MLEAVVVLTKQGLIGTSPCFKSFWLRKSLDLSDFSEQISKRHIEGVYSWYLPALECVCFLGRSSWLAFFFSAWLVPWLVVAFSVSSRKMYFSALIWISSGVRAGHLDNELLKGPGHSPLSRVRTAAWVCNSSTSNISALYCLRKSRSDSPCHWDIPSKLETGFGLNFWVVK